MLRCCDALQRDPATSHAANTLRELCERHVQDPIVELKELSERGIDVAVLFLSPTDPQRPAARGETQRNARRGAQSPRGEHPGLPAAEADQQGGLWTRVSRAEDRDGRSVRGESDEQERLAAEEPATARAVGAPHHGTCE